MSEKPPLNEGNLLDFQNFDVDKYRDLLRIAIESVITKPQFPRQRVHLNELGVDAIFSSKEHADQETKMVTIALNFAKDTKPIQFLHYSLVFYSPKSSDTRLIVGGDILNKSGEAGGVSATGFLTFLTEIDDMVCTTLANHYNLPVHRRIGASVKKVEDWARERGFVDDPEIQGSKIPELVKVIEPIDPGEHD